MLPSASVAAGVVHGVDGIKGPVHAEKHSSADPHPSPPFYLVGRVNVGLACT